MTGQTRTLVDTSVAIPLLVASHGAHEAVASWAARRMLFLGGHALVETYSVLTRLPGDARVAPQDAVVLIDDNFIGFDERPVGPGRVHDELARSGIAGGAVYDGLVGLAALEHGAILATRDARARSTYEALGVPVEMVYDGGQPQR